MIQLKPLSKTAIPAALAKAERYRLLNEPDEAESICLDVLQIDPDNQDALIMLLLALSDQFPTESSGRASALAVQIAGRLRGDYERGYYSGIISERRGRAALHKGRPATLAAEWLREAMGFYERAEALREPGNDDTILRWNACARILMTLPATQIDTNEPEPLQLE